MSEELRKGGITRREQYEILLPQIEALLEDEPDAVACMANVAAAIMDTFHFWWVGFYRTEEQELVLGPFQGPLACTRIKHGKGVCGTAWAEARTLVVDDVDLFPGHIACSSRSRSEIVVPLQADGRITGVLDIDSEHLAHFSPTDAHYLSHIAHLVAQKMR